MSQGGAASGGYRRALLSVPLECIWIDAAPHTAVGEYTYRQSGHFAEG